MAKDIKKSPANVFTILETVKSVCPRLGKIKRIVLEVFGVVCLIVGWSFDAFPAISTPVLKWVRGGCFTSWCQTGWYSSPAVADLDGDGQKEVVWGSYDLVAVNGATGQLRWRASNSNRVWPGVAIGDLTGDGSLEIIVGRSGDELTVYNASGGVVWSIHPFGGGEIRSLAVEDLEQDGKLEIIVGRASGGSTQQMSVIEANGTVRSGWPARRDGEPGYGWGMYNENVAAGDLNGDGFKEIIGPTDTHYITALDRNGNQLPANAIYGANKVWSQVGVHVDHQVDLRGYANCGSEHRPNFADSAPTLADLNGDGVLEIVVVGNVYNCGTDPYTSLYQMPFLFKVDRTRWSGSGFDWTVIPTPHSGSTPLSEDYNIIETAEPNPVAADLDGDGFKEILFASYDGKVHCYWLDKTEHGNWPYQVPGTGIRFASEPVVADLDNDGHAEVLFTSWPEAVAGRNGQLHILDYLGNPLQAVDLPSPAAGNWNGALGAPTLADIDGDGELEALVGTVSTGLAAYDLPGSGKARVLWETGRGNMKRTGVSPSTPNDHSIHLAAGWNWVSFRSLPVDRSFNSFFALILDQIEQVKTQAQSAVYSNGQWLGDLPNMNGISLGIMYKIKVKQPCTLSLTGQSLAANQPIALGANWNWVAFLPQTAMSLTSALGSIAGQVQQIKNGSQSAIYSNGQWSGTLTQLDPGKGYALKMSSAGTLIYPLQ
jgi:hypothetical protein